MPAYPKSPTDNPGAVSKGNKLGGYPKVNFLTFIMAVGVVAMPISYFKMSGQREWIWKYILLITLMLAIYYQNGLARFFNFYQNIQTELIQKAG